MAQLYEPRNIDPTFKLTDNIIETKRLNLDYNPSFYTTKGCFAYWKN